MEQKTTVQDDVMADPNWPTGSGEFECKDSKWIELSATCECGPQCGCLAAGGRWIEAQPERERTCTGNTGCTTHTHSCTTAADPAGGYQSCTYKKHKGGALCASHSHATCEPYPAAAAHCHLNIDEICPICNPFQ